MGHGVASKWLKHSQCRPSTIMSPIALHKADGYVHQHKVCSWRISGEEHSESEEKEQAPKMGLM